MSSEAFSSHLAYPELKRKAVSSRNYRARIAPSNGSSFVCGNSVVRLEIPANQQHKFADLSQSYIKLTVRSTAAFTLDRGGAYSLFSKLNVSSGGVTISDVDEYNLLMTTLLTSESTPQYLGSVGALMLGTRGDVLSGQTYAPDTDYTFCMPLAAHALATTTPSRFCPLFGRSNIVFELTTAAPATCVVSAGAPVITVSNVSYVVSVVELSAPAFAELDMRCQGSYNMLASQWTSNRAVLSANATSLSATLGISATSLERIICVHRDAADISDQATFSLGAHARAGLTSYALFVNGESFPAQPIQVSATNLAETCAEILVSQHALSDFRTGNMLMHAGTLVGVDNGADPAVVTGGFIANPLSGVGGAIALQNPFSLNNANCTTAGLYSPNAAGTASNVGSYHFQLELESGLSRGATSHIYSGINTVGAVVQLATTYAGTNATFSVSVFAQSTVVVALDTRASGNFMVAI